jgi:hypothetical protein
MPDIIAQLKKAKETVHLSAERKEAVRAHLLEAMSAPARAEAALARHGARPQATRARFGMRFRIVTAAVAGVVLASTGVSFAAEQTRPGDALYPVKVHVTEPVRAAFAFSPSAKAQVAIARAEARLNEASSLSSEGKLDAATEAQLQATFDEQAAVADRNLNTLHDTGDVQDVAALVVRFEGTLRAQEAILGSLRAAHTGEGQGTTTSTPDLGASVRGRIQALSEFRALLQSHLAEDADASSTAPTSSIGQAAESAAQAEVAQALTVTAAIHADLGSNKNADLLRAANARAEVARELAAEAEQKLEAHHYAQAFMLANNAIGVAAEARSLAAATLRLKTNVTVGRHDDGSTSSAATSSSSLRERRMLQRENISTSSAAVQATSSANDQAGATNESINAGSSGSTQSGSDQEGSHVPDVLDL